jgi:hypothetical protein
LQFIISFIFHLKFSFATVNQAPLPFLRIFALFFSIFALQAVAIIDPCENFNAGLNDRLTHLLKQFSCSIAFKSGVALCLLIISLQWQQFAYAFMLSIGNTFSMEFIKCFFTFTDGKFNNTSQGMQNCRRIIKLWLCGSFLLYHISGTYISEMLIYVNPICAFYDGMSLLDRGEGSSKYN